LLAREDAHRTLLTQLQCVTSLSCGQFLEGFSLPDAPAFGGWVRFQREYWHLHIEELYVQLPFTLFHVNAYPLFLLL